MKKISSVALAVAGLSAAAVAISTPAVASADVKVVLPAQTGTQTLGDGTKVTLSRSNERANINPSLGGTPLHRNAWVSAVYNVKTSKKVNSIKVQAGYIVGCQVNLNSLTNSGNGSGSVPSSGTPTASVGAGESITVGPGQAVNYWVFDRETADDFGNDSHSTKINYKKTDHGRLSYTNQTIMVNGCGGYAQARSIANVSVDTDNARQILTFYGRPFSLG
ncbi:MspA family porin [Gordonia sp. CPCC 205333]|uniref:MspA family porin n=1 Tax=Gordonia sp. CPCC 205333 TaxID=3140790 RepID=UPI003AF3FC45